MQRWSEGSAGDRSGGPYRIDEADGTWWLVGWDRPLRTLYAQHLLLEPSGEEEVLDLFGTRPREVPTVARLADLIGKSLPAHVTQALNDDAEASPAEGSAPVGYIPLAERDHSNQADFQGRGGEADE